jgi:small subunit ribosomal protein S16
MALKIRLRQQGRTNRSFYRLVLTDSRSPRDGKYLELLGWYNPIEAEENKKLSFKADRIEYWLGLGAQLTETAESLVKKASPQIIQNLKKRELERKAKALTKLKAKKHAQA